MPSTTGMMEPSSAGQHTLGTSAKKDEKRALDKDGIEQCGYIGRALAARGVQVDVIISSPLKRATQTAALVGNEMGHEGKLVHVLVGGSVGLVESVVAVQDAVPVELIDREIAVAAFDQDACNAEVEDVAFIAADAVGGLFGEGGS